MMKPSLQSTNPSFWQKIDGFKKLYDRTWKKNNFKTILDIDFIKETKL